MNGFYFYQSNQQKVLLQQMARILDTPLKASVMVPEIILVPTPIIKQYLSLHLAKHFGILANIHYFYPHQFLEWLASPLYTESHYKQTDKSFLCWSLMRILPQYFQDPRFRVILAPLQKQEDSSLMPLRLFQLCERIATLFERYTLYRPEMLQKWESQEISEIEEDFYWQYLLWNKIYKEPFFLHTARLLEKIKKSPTSNYPVPERICLFGFSQLTFLTAPYLRLLQQLSTRTPIHLFALNPCEQYWLDIETEQTIAQKERQFQAKKPQETIELHYEVGNPFLASFGKTGREFFQFVSDLDLQENHDSLFVAPQSDTLLAQMQKDILRLKEPKASFSFSETDTSIRIQSCPNELREVEVLFHSLLWMFETMPHLKPWEICVMAPAIDPYVPYIKAVFGEVSEEKHQMPYSILGQTYSQESVYIQVFFLLLDLPQSRLHVSEVLNLFEFRPIIEGFNLDEADLQLFRRWIREASIHWGQNATHQQQMGLPEIPENTWEFGINRLLLSYASGTLNKEELFFQWVPACEIRESEFETFGHFLSFFDYLHQWCNEARKTHTLSEWERLLRQLLERFFGQIKDDYARREIASLRNEVQQLKTLEKDTHFNDPIDLSALRYFLKKRFERTRTDFVAFHGGITFSSMQTTRGIPFRVLYLLGLNEDNFPQSARPLHFDRIGRHPQQGDPHPAQEEKYMFLEAFLAAQEKLWLSSIYLGAQHQFRLQPSLVIQELIENIRRYIPEGSERFCVEHPMESYHPKYFQNNPSWINYSREYFEASQLLIAQEKNVSPPTLYCPETFQKLGEPDETHRQVELTKLIKFFRNPTAFFFQNRLSLFVEEYFQSLDDHEPFTLHPFVKNRLCRAILKWRLTDRPLEQLKAITLAQGILPSGTFGPYVFQELVQEIEPFLKKIQQYGALLGTISFWEGYTQEQMERVSFVEFEPFLKQTRSREKEGLEFTCFLKLPEIIISPFRISGDLSQIRQDGQVIISESKLGVPAIIKLWLAHLLFNSIQESIPCSRESHLICFDQTYSLSPLNPDESLSYLKQILELYWKGLQVPLALCSQASFHYVYGLQKGKTEEQSINIAKNIWYGDPFRSKSGEGDSPYFKRCFGAELPLEFEFCALAKQFWEPFFATLKSLENLTV